MNVTIIRVLIVLRLVILLLVFIFNLVYLAPTERAVVCSALAKVLLAMPNDLKLQYGMLKFWLCLESEVMLRSLHINV
jgi:hypothetical protein